MALESEEPAKCCHRVASPRTIKDVRTVLRSALQSAVRQELIDRNVAQLVQIPKQRKRKLVPWTSDEARRFLESARSSSDPLYAAYVLVLVLGLRKGEVLGLAWQAVDFEQGTLVPDHQLQRVRRSLLYRETKTEASDAWLPMPDIVAAALTIRRAQQDGERETAGEIWQQTKRHAVAGLHRSLWHSDRSTHSQQEVHGALRGRGSASDHCS